MDVNPGNVDMISDPVTQDYINEARKAQEEWRYQDILDICAEAQDKTIVHPRLITAKSFALVGLKRYREAQELLEKSVEEYPDDPDLHYNLAATYIARSRRNHARVEASRVLELLQEVDPNEINERLSVVKGGSLLILHRSREAIRFLEYEVARFPESPTLHSRLAAAYGKRLHWIKTLKQAKLIPGEHNKYIRRRLILLPASLILYLMTVVGVIAYSHISQNFFLPLFIFILLSFIVVMINRPKVLFPPDRSSIKRDVSSEHEDDNAEIGNARSN